MNSLSLRLIASTGLLLGLVAGTGCTKKTEEPPAASPAQGTTAAAVAQPSPTAQPSVPASPMATNMNPDLTIDASGLSKATVIMTTGQGVVKFKFYTNDAPNTTKRLVELINKGFYNGLTFHRYVPNFVIQGGDPMGTGMGGSGQKLKAEFNNRKHVEGTLAMARASDPDSADSQFYICLGTLENLDHNYTVFGQTIEGMDVVKKLRVGDKILSMVIQ